jgi:hypothetical protein
MRRLHASGATLLTAFLTWACAPDGPDLESHAHYRSLSRFTDPGSLSPLLGELPGDATGIARVAEHLTVHHNLLPYHGIPKERWVEMSRIWPPKAPEVLAALQERAPHNLYDERPLENRVVGACMSESHLLASLLRHREIPVRIRAGYFKDVRGDAQHVIRFWEDNARARGINTQLLESDPERWREENNANTARQVELDHHIEHWAAEYWDEERKAWRLLDANRTFLEASSNIEVGYHLPRKHFGYAHEAWQDLSTQDGFEPDQYYEWPQDGRSHIRSQLLWDFFSLLNHDIAGLDRSVWATDDTATEEQDTYTFVKERTYEELPSEELDELDRLAELLSEEPTRDHLVAFYHKSRTIRSASAEKDPYSFLFAE